jgi:hypothetical protein
MAKWGEKALCVVNDGFQDHVRASNCLRNVHRDVPANVQTIRFVRYIELCGPVKGFT